LRAEIVRSASLLAAQPSMAASVYASMATFYRDAVVSGAAVAKKPGSWREEIDSRYALS
jgi:hypothetical protein